MAKDWGWRRIRSETKILNAKDALELAVAHNELAPSPTERKFEESRLRRLKDVLVDGRSVSYNWATVVFNGVESRMNGQHSSRAIVESKDVLPEKLVFHVDQYAADNREGMANLFQQFDPRGSARSKLDVSGAHQGLNPELDGCDRQMANLAIEGVAWYRRKVLDLPAPSGDELGQLFWEIGLPPYIRWSSALLADRALEMRMEPVVAAMYGTFAKHESGARNFWQQVAVGTLSADDSQPAVMLSRALQNDRAEVKRRKSKKGGLPAKSKKGGLDVELMTEAQMYGVCFMAWNSFCKHLTPKALVFDVDNKKKLPTIEMVPTDDA